MRIGAKPGVRGWTLAELEAFWAAAEEGGFRHISVFDHPLAAPAPFRAWDAPSLLIAMAARTANPALCIDVLIVSWRNPLELASQLAVAQALSGGRVEISFGAGTKRLGGHVHRALGLPFPPRQERLARVEAFCRALPALWRGERVTDELLRLDAASIGAVGIDPPRISIGGASDEILTLIARAADGWNYAQEPDLGNYEVLAAKLDDTWARAGRPAKPFKTVQLQVDELVPAEARRLARDFAAAGADALTFAFLRERRPEAVRKLGEAVLA
jgi:alkanesulfonate monooxygenase SsuD/methylene tetrahydromethanopterin reductase-like flavin-dependent oxidoreductase (luciferase family)